MQDVDSGRHPDGPETVTRLLGRVRGGEQAAVHELVPLVYEQLQALARAVFSSEAAQHTLQPTAIVHEAWIKMSGNLDPVQNRRHFFIIAGKAMRQVIADHARRKNSLKRGGGQRRLMLDTRLGATDSPAVDLVELDDSLNKLADQNQSHAAVAELRLFSGLSIAETAEALDLSPRTVDSAWAMAKAWLRRDLAGSG